MLRSLLCVISLALSVTALRADVFSFSYAGVFLGNSVSASGTLTATAGLGGLYTITDLSGKRNGVLISDPSAGKGTFTFDGPSSVGTLTFLINGSQSSRDVLTFTGNTYVESGVTGANIGSTFSITRAPEPSTLLSLVVMGLSVWGITRKLSGKDVSLS